MSQLMICSGLSASVCSSTEFSRKFRLALNCLAATREDHIVVNRVSQTAYGYHLGVNLGQKIRQSLAPVGRPAHWQLNRPGGPQFQPFVTNLMFLPHEIRIQMVNGRHLTFPGVPFRLSLVAGASAAQGIKRPQRPLGEPQPVDAISPRRWANGRSWR